MTGRYSAYPCIKDSGEKWIGHVPDHWDIQRLGKFFDERRDKVSDKDYPPLSVTMNGIVPQLETAAKTDAGDNRKLVRKNDFVINSRSDRKGSAGVSRLDGSVSLISIVLEPRNIFPNYVHHLLRSYPFQEEFYRFGKGIVADLWSTNVSEMRNINLPIPSKQEQTQIANFLDHETAKIDTLIDKQQQLIKLLKEKRQAVISHAVTKGLNPDAPMKDSGVEWLGAVPEHWEVKQLRHLTTSIGGGTPSKENPSFWDGNIPWVSPKDMKKDYLDNSQDKITEQAILNSSAKLIPELSVLIVVRGMILAHSVPVALTLIPVTINQDMKAFITHRCLLPEFLLFALQGAKSVLLDMMEQSAHGTKVLSTELLNRLSLGVPPIEEQRSILNELKRRLKILDSTSDRAEEFVKLSNERRTALISAAVTGKIDVRNWKPEPSEQPMEATA